MNDAFGHPQSVLVLGGTSEIARSILRELVARRARRIVLAGRDAERLKEAADELRALGADDAEVLGFDALDTAGHERLIEDVFSRRGDIDLVLVAFGVLGRPERDHTDPVAAAELARINYVGSVSVGTAVANQLRRQGHGTLVVLSSVAGIRVRPANYLYGSSKAGMDAFFQGLGDSLAGTGARVMIVRPGFVRTRMTAGLRPAPFATTPQDVALCVLRGLETGASTVWAPPPLRWVMVLFGLLPRAVIRRLPA